MKTKEFTSQQLETIRTVVREELDKPFAIDDEMRRKVKEGVEQVDRGETVSAHDFEKEFGKLSKPTSLYV